MNFKMEQIPYRGRNKYYSYTNNSSSSTTIINNNAGGTTTLTPHLIWGQSFDGTQDVEGDITIGGQVLGYSTYNDGSNFKFTPTGSSANSRFDFNQTDVRLDDSALYIGDDITIDTSAITAPTINTDTINSLNGAVTIDAIDTGTITADFADLVDMYANTGTIETLGSTTINSETVNSGTVNVDEINPLNGSRVEISNTHIDQAVIDDADIEQLDAEDANIHNLNVTGLAHFYELVIDQVSHAGGMMILSPGSFVIDKVGSDTTYQSSIVNYHLSNWITGGYDDTLYRCKRVYQLKGDDVTRTVIGGDFVICQSFDVDKGTHSDVGNHYYWTVCINSGDTVVGDQDYYFYDLLIDFDMSNGSTSRTHQVVSQGDPSSMKEGDNCALLGSVNTDRQNAIILSSYNTGYIDTGIQAPSIAQYQGIDHIRNIRDKRTTWFAKNGNQIKGDLMMSTGQSIQELINEIETEFDTFKTFVAYANSSDGEVDFIKAGDSRYDPEERYAYIGLCSATDENALIPSDYTWTSISNDVVSYIVIPDGTSNSITIQPDIPVGWQPTDPIANEGMIHCSYHVYKVIGNQKFMLSTAELAATNGVISFDGVSDTITMSKNASGQFYYSGSIPDTLLHTVEQLGTVKVSFTNDSGNMYRDDLPVVYLAQSVLDVADVIRSWVTDDRGRLSVVEQTATSLTATVADHDAVIDGLDSRFSQVQIYADQITANVVSGLEETGIDITNNMIVAKADTFEVQDNDGNTTCTIEEGGVLTTTSGNFSNVTISGAINYAVSHVNKDNYYDYFLHNTTSGHDDCNVRDLPQIVIFDQDLSDPDAPWEYGAMELELPWIRNEWTTRFDPDGSWSNEYSHYVKIKDGDEWRVIHLDDIRPLIGRKFIMINNSGQDFFFIGLYKKFGQEGYETTSIRIPVGRICTLECKIAQYDVMTGNIGETIYWDLYAGGVMCVE